MDMDSFEFSMELCNDSSLHMIVNGLFQESNILGIDALRGEFTQELDEILFISEDAYIYKNILEDYIDFDAEIHKKPISGITSRISFNLTPGSSTSMNFLELVQKCNDQMVF